ncbi:MAG: hypothetical protein HY532_05370 [Chloroflexi bacterium]|nr:hypothetical protein [Chloroflexota bacterium]
MLNQVYALSTVVALALAGLVVSNVLYDRGVPSSVSRCIASALGGVAILVAVLWLDAWTAIALSGVLALFILVLRLGFRRGLRGASGRLPSQAWAEVTYAVAGTTSLAVGWGLLGDRWLAFVPIAFMAWGDNAAGLARATLWRHGVASLWPSLAMLGVCLATAVLFQPYWVGAVGAVVATAAERYRPRIADVWDDNLNVVAMSLAVMSVLVGIGR